MRPSPRLDLIGLGVRSGQVVIGTGGVRAALQKGQLVLVVLAGDASPRTGEKVERLARGLGVPTATAPSADALGRAVGRGAVQAVGVKDRHLARGIVPGLA